MVFARWCRNCRVAQWAYKRKQGKYDKQDKEFENALAGVINEMWQDLTDQEKEEIRRILNEW